MPEQTQLEWMTQQRDQLKTELDALNPKYDATVAALADARELNKALAAEIDQLKVEQAAKDGQIAGQRDALAAAKEELNGTRMADNQAIGRLHAEAAELTAKLDQSEVIVARQRALIKKWYAVSADVFSQSLNEAIEQKAE